MTKDMFQVRNEIVDSKRIILLKKVRKNFYFSCINHLLVIILLLISLYIPTSNFIQYFSVDSNFVLLIEPLSIFIASAVLLIVSGLGEIYNNNPLHKNKFITFFTDLIPYLFILFMIISIFIIKYNFLVGIIILNIISKIWSAGNMGEKKNLYISFLIFIPMALYSIQYSINPAMVYINYLLIIFIIKIFPFLQEYREIINLDRHDIDKIISRT